MKERLQIFKIDGFKWAKIGSAKNGLQKVIIDKHLAETDHNCWVRTSKQLGVEKMGIDGGKKGK